MRERENRERDRVKVEAITQIRRFRFTRRRIEMCVPHTYTEDGGKGNTTDALPSSATSCRRAEKGKGRGTGRRIYQCVGLLKF